jgi:hypothetical protein
MRGLRFIAVAALLLAAPSGAPAQSKDLTGSWTLVSSVVEQVGNKIEPFGPTRRAR